MNKRQRKKKAKRERERMWAANRHALDWSRCRSTPLADLIGFIRQVRAMHAYSASVAPLDMLFR